MKKPSNLKFTNHTLSCAESLKREQDEATDILIYPLITLQQLTEDTYDIYRMEKIQWDDTLCQIRLYTHASRLKTQLDRWKSTVPSEVKSSCMAKSSSLFYCSYSLH